jgi:TRAP-type C4-dicarboxylate transport system permease small subunit
MMRFINRATELFFIACIAGIVVVVFGQVVMRYVLRDVPPWTEELARSIFGWIVFLGTPIAYRYKAHIVIDLIVSRISSQSRKKLGVVIFAVMAGFLGFVLVEGIINLWLAKGDLSPVMEVSMAIFYLPLPVGVGLTLLYVLKDLVCELAGKKN